MTPERWQHIDSVFHAALERPPEERARFLKEACAGDEAARSEIEALIMAHEQSGEFLDRPAYEGPNKTLSAQPLKQTPGTILGHYKILGALGEGGMGQVYLALDTRLDRKIALKLLPPEFTSDGGRVRRFEQEARAASALSHPNVCVIHEIGGTADGLQFIAMEYIEGMTLRQRIAQKRLKLSESLDIAIQTAAGLAVAHAAGIIHRDIKPENVMLRSDGLVKILDFGLAKLTERQTIETETEPLMRSLAQTGPGMIMGTVAYMSPEQARGLPVDARTDIWTFGVVLYEMVVGQQPFSGPTPSDLLVSILEREPPRVTHKLGEAPAELERILRKALKKDREERYQVVKDMALDLKSLSQELKHKAALEHAAMPAAPTAEAQIAAGAAQAAVATHEKLSARTDEVSAARWASSAEYFVSEIKRHKVTTWLILSTIVIAAAGIVFWYKLSNHNQAVAPLSAKLFQHTSMRKLTTNGNALVAAISPNGKYVAYVTFERPSSPQATGKSSLWIRQVTTTGNIQIVSPAEVWYQSVTFSPDGDYVFYVVTDTQNATALYKVPALGQGSSPIKIMGGVTSGVSLSPNGKQITFVRHDPAHKEARLMVADADGTNEQILATRKSPESFGRGPFTARPAWSPDGKVIACSVWVPDSQGLYANVLAVNVADRVEKVLLPHRWSEVTDVSWLSDGSGLLMNAKEQEASFWQLWLLSYPGGEARRITGDLSDYDRSVNLTADSTALISMQEQTLSNIWISPNGHGGRATQITSGAGRYFDLSWTADGQILYASDASGSAEIWEMESGRGAKQLTAGTGRNYGPIASPDGRYIIFHSTRLGRTFHIWRMDADGNNPKQLTSGNTESNFAQISPDGQWVVYTQIVSTGAQNVWKVSIDGGTPVQLTDKDSLRPSISPDGKMIACWQSDNQPSPTWHIALIPFAGGPPLKLLEIPPGEAASWGQPLLWSPDGSAVTYVDQLNAVNNVWSQPIDGGKPTQLTDFKSDQIFSFNWSRDGKLVLSRGVSTSDVVMISDSP